MKLSFEKHLRFLEYSGYVECSHNRGFVELTASGRIFVQPELAEFVNRDLLPDIISRLEGEIKTLTYPEEEKAGLIFRLREAVAKNATDVIVKVLVEIAVRMAESGHA